VIDKKGKLFGKVSIIDVVIIVVVIGAIVGFAYKLTKSNAVTPFTKTDQLEITLFADDIDKFVIDAIQIGDVVKDRSANVVFGTLESIEVADARIQGIDIDGKVVLSSRPDHVSLKIKVRGTGIYSENSLTSIGNVNYYLNRSMEVAIGDVIGWLRISDIKKVN